MKEYALYKGDNLLSIGTMAEIAKDLGIKESTVYFYSTSAYKKRETKENNQRVLVALDDDEDEVI